MRINKEKGKKQNIGKVSSHLCIFGAVSDWFKKLLKKGSGAYSIPEKYYQNYAFEHASIKEISINQASSN